MARGDVHLFAAFELTNKSGKAFNLATDALKLGIVTNATVPSVTTADPRWGAGGGTDLSAGQVALGTGYTGPVSLTSVTFTETGAISSLKAANVTIPQDASGFTTGYYGVLYDSTVAGNYAIGYIDLGGPIGIQSGPLNINWNAGGIATWTAA